METVHVWKIQNCCAMTKFIALDVKDDDAAIRAAQEHIRANENPSITYVGSAVYFKSEED